MFPSPDMNGAFRNSDYLPVADVRRGGVNVRATCENSILDYDADAYDLGGGGAGDRQDSPRLAGSPVTSPNSNMAGPPYRAPEFESAAPGPGAKGPCIEAVVPSTWSGRGRPDHRTLLARGDSLTGLPQLVGMRSRGYGR